VASEKRDLLGLMTRFIDTRTGRCGQKQGLALQISCLVLASVVLVPSHAASYAALRSIPEKKASDSSAQEVQKVLPGFLEAIKQAASALVEKQCDIVFSEVDHDSSGRLDSAELHVALLLVYGRLNQMLGGMALGLPRSREVKVMLIAADDGDGSLTRDEFKKFFMRLFVRRLAALVSARLLTQKVLIPLGAVSISLLAEELDVNKQLEHMLASSVESSNIIMRKLKRAVMSKSLDKLGPAVGPFISLAAAGAIVNGLKAELHLARAFDSAFDSEDLGHLHM